MFYIPYDCPQIAADRHCRPTVTALHPAALLAREVAAWGRRLCSRRRPNMEVPETTRARRGLIPPNRSF